ncbi:virulence factor MviN [Streptosporangiaceae bacterium NEAU-GS5]|nr:virulence factor MviN [Streptosporangiaceae bacterium NEAU-GS5]
MSRGVAGAAVLIGAITILARVTGFAKQLVFARAVGTNCLATAYYTANQVPNIVFELVVGGALAGMVVPVLAGRVDATAEAGRIASALMTWVLTLLVPLAIVVGLLAGPITGLFTGGVRGCDPAALGDVAARMLVVFAPQIPLYGMAVVLYGLLQAHRRFTAPALAPLVSSVVVIVAYLAFAPLSEGLRDPAQVPRPAELALSAGTSLGVLALVVTVLGPAARLGLPWRPAYRFPDGVAPIVRRLALAGLAALLAQQVAMAVALKLANAQGGAGVLAAYNYAWAIYMVPYAVLAVPIATSAFPELSARAGDGSESAFAALASRTTRAVTVISGLAAGALAAVATPVAAVFLSQTDTQVPEADFARAIALFAPGLVGFGLMTHLSRVLYADGRGRAAARGQVLGWAAVVVAQTVFVFAFPDEWKLGGLALGQTAGMTLGGVLLLAAVWRARGRAVLAGMGRASVAAVAGGVAGFLAGTGVAVLLGSAGPWRALVTAVAAGIAAVGVGGLVAASVDPSDVRATLAKAGRPS